MVDTYYLIEDSAPVDHFDQGIDVSGRTVYGNVADSQYVKDDNGKWWLVSFDSEKGDFILQDPLCLVVSEA